MSTPREVWVLGAGPCGLAAAHSLAQNGIPVHVLEANPEIGGLAATLPWGASHHDLGPHKLYTLDKILQQRVQSLLPENQWLVHSKQSAIYHSGYLSYPPTLFQLLKNFGPNRVTRCLKDYAVIQLADLAGLRVQAGDSFEDDAQKRAGRGFYELLLKPVAEKIWGAPATLDAALSQSRIQLPQVRNLLKKLTHRTARAWDADQYFYPHGGLRSLWTTMRRDIESRGGSVKTGEAVVRLHHQDQRLIRMDTSTGRSIDLTPSDTSIISTFPVKHMLAALSPAPPLSILSMASSLTLNDLHLVFLKCRSAWMRRNTWIFVPDASIVFHRVSRQSAFDPQMVEPPIQDILCCEIMDFPDKGTDVMDDNARMESCVDGLIRMGILKGPEDVSERRLIKLKSSYPVMKKGYKDALQGILAYCDAFQNLRTIGRQGAYHYIGSLDAMDIGFGIGDLLAQGKVSAGDWAKERERTSYYPILD